MLRDTEGERRLVSAGAGGGAGGGSADTGEGPSSRGGAPDAESLVGASLLAAGLQPTLF
jgi:hypothetical protein